MPRRSSRRACRDSRRARADRSREDQPRGACAVLGGAGVVSRDSSGGRSRRRSSPCSVHLAESAEEVEFIAERGRAVAGASRRSSARGSPSWAAPGVSPVQYLDEQRVSRPRAIAVHGVQMSADDLARLAARGATLVTCPRSNAYTGAGTPPIEQFYESGVRVAVGTDSLASCPTSTCSRSSRACARWRPRSRRAGCSRARRATGPARSASRPTTERSTPAEARAPAGGRGPADLDDVEEYLVSGSSRSRSAGFTETRDCDSENRAFGKLGQ